MKRHTALILAFALFFTGLSTLPATVFADYDKEITFRGLPMGASIEEVRSKLIEDGVDREEIQVGENHIEGFFSDNYPEKYEYIIVYDAGYGGTIYDTGKLRLAGYEISFLSVYFMCEMADGLPVMEQESAGLIKAFYWIDTKDQFAVYADLKQKLTNLYGAPVESRNSSNFSNADTEIKDISIWYGANGTAVYIACEWSTQDGVTKILNDDDMENSVFVMYGKPGIYETLEQIENYKEQLAYEAEQKLIEEAGDDTTGL